MTEEDEGWSPDPVEFAPLHDFTLELIDELQRHYEVVQTEGGDPTTHLDLEGVEFARPSIRLTPSDPESIPLVFFFTTEPSVWVQTGRLRLDLFPLWTWTLEETKEALRESLEEWVTGTWHEVIDIPRLGKASKHIEVYSPSGGMSGLDDSLSRKEALSHVRETGGAHHVWRPWTRR